MISELPAEDVDELQWCKSSYSGNSSEDRPGPHLRFTPATWEAFVTYAVEN